MYDGTVKVIGGRRLETRVYEDISPEEVLLAILQPRARADQAGAKFVSRPLPAHWRKRLAHVGE